MATTASSTFRIKLLSGNNVVLVEAAGYDSEIFMPEVVNGRLTFLNIIPERRCCDNPVTLKRSRPHKKADKGKYARPQSPLHPNKPPKIISDTSSHSTSSLKTQAPNRNFSHSPQAFSTPMPAKRRSPVRHNPSPSWDKENELPTPPAARCAFAAAAANAKTYQVPSPFQVLRETHMPIPPGIKMVRLFRNPSPAKPKDLAHVATINLDDSPKSPERQTPRKGILHRSPRRSANSSSFDLPPSPHLALATAIEPGPARTGKRSSSSPLPSKWRHKVITPIRTYSRRRIAGGTEPAAILKGDPLLATGMAMPVQAKKSTSRDTEPPPQPAHPHIYPKVIPTYLVNPTQGTHAQCTVQFRRKRKLVVDERTQLSPRRAPGEAAAAEERETVTSAANPIPSPGAASIRGSCEHRCNDTPTRRRRTSLPRTRRHYERSKMSAFALLTNPSRPFCLSARLLAQFRKGCINKAASTYAKCKVLATLPPENPDTEA